MSEVPHLPTVAEFFTDPKPCHALEEMRQALNETSLIDEISQRALEDWNAINDRIVGAEDEDVPLF